MPSVDPDSEVFSYVSRIEIRSIVDKSDYDESEPFSFECIEEILGEVNRLTSPMDG